MAKLHTTILLIILVINKLVVNSINVTVSDSDPITINNAFNMADFIKSYGYPVEVHKNLQTDDGYLIDIFRIPYGRSNNSTGKRKRKNRGPVLLMHGLESNGECFVVLGPDMSLGFYLADKGYDVWIGNTRGNSHGMRHVRLDPNEFDFWEYSWHEIGIYDLPAIIDHILATTNVPKLTYVGHSQGTTTYFVMSSEKPEYNKKIRAMVAMAPSAYLGLQELTLGQEQRWILYEQIDQLRKMLKVTEIGSQVNEIFCNPTITAPGLCETVKDFLVTMVGFIDPLQMVWEKKDILMQIFPDSSALKQSLHYLQSILSGEFRLYDFGKEQNLIKYNASVPPLYKLENVKAPLALFYAVADTITMVRNSRRLLHALPNVVRDYIVPFLTFSHLDFVIAKDVTKLINDPLFDFISKYD